MHDEMINHIYKYLWLSHSGRVSDVYEYFTPIYSDQEIALTLALLCDFEGGNFEQK
jgi:hypothetical protein